MKPQPRTLAQTIVHVLGANLVWVALLVASFACAGMFAPGEVTMVAPEAPAAAAPSLVEQLIEDGGCWTGEAPADMVGVLPGHVVVSQPGVGPRMAGERMVGLALQQIFDGVDHDLTVHGFCR